MHAYYTLRAPVMLNSVKGIPSFRPALNVALSINLKESLRKDNGKRHAEFAKKTFLYLLKIRKGKGTNNFEN